MSERKKKICLSMYEKSLILQKIKNGESRDMILNKYKITDRCLRKIIQHADHVNNKAKDFEFRNKKSMKSTENVELETALLKWIIQKRDSNQLISATMVQQKARIFNEMLKGPATFKASDGWFSLFKKRHGLRKLSLKGEILSNNIDSAKEFSKLLIEKITKENLKLENIYNADESGIYWKILLNYTFVLTENSVAGFKDSEDRFTALFCANASGSHRIPLLIIGKAAKTRHLKNGIAGKAKLHDINYLPKLDVSHSAQKRGWMNCEIFKKWYEYEFIPRVQKHQRKTGNGGKVLLILDNAPSHPSKEELNAINENFEVMFLPQNVTALIQPMDQSPISSTKKHYKKNLMRKLLIEKDYEKIETFLKELNLRDCLVMLSKGWSSVKQSTLKNAWKALLHENMGTQNYENLMHDKDSSSCETNASVENSNPIHEFCEHLANCLSKEDKENKEMSIKVKSKVEEWFNADEGDNGCEIMSDEQIVQSIVNRQSNFDDLKSPSMVVDEVVDQTENICEELLENEIAEDNDENIAANKALESFLNFKDWMITHVQCSESQILHFNECESILRNATNNSQKKTLY